MQKDKQYEEYYRKIEVHEFIAYNVRRSLINSISITSVAKLSIHRINYTLRALNRSTACPHFPVPRTGHCVGSGALRLTEHLEEHEKFVMSEIAAARQKGANLRINGSQKTICIKVEREEEMNE